ncbi:MAG: glycosyltransferase family 39 protein [Candidatus Omnitrophica bacterium]|nr:glycosyltransferase family 39 protein [Candidatus Omnitrophota bacterium]
MRKAYTLIDNLLDLCCTKRAGTILAISFIAVFFILSLTRNYDYKSFESILNATGDDWGIYAQHALDIKHNGMLMPSAISAYCSPAGFLYNYFIALCLVIFGEKSLPIFVVQHLMLGFSVALVYWTFRDKMRGLTGILFLCVLFFFALKDVYKNYSPLLLSENLALFTVALFFFCFIKGFEKDNLFLQIMAAFLLGLSILTRPNIFVYGIALMPLVALYYVKRGGAGYRNLLIFALALIAGSSFLGIRNYLFLKQFIFLPTNMSSIDGLRNFHPIPSSVDLSRVAGNLLYTKLHIDKLIVNYVEYIRQEPGLFFQFYFKKVLFCLGYLPSLLAGSYGPRLRWMAMWAGYFTYLFLHIRNREKWEIWEVSVHLYIFCYYGSLVLTTTVHNYGFRMLIPAIFFVLVFAFMALDRLLSAVMPAFFGPDRPAYLH